MTAPPPLLPGRIGWVDLTVPDAPVLRDFYAAVTDWSPQPLSMGDYDDYVMMSPDGEAIAGICHARGGNTGLPPQWLVYIIVTGLDERLSRVAALGGRVLRAPKPAGPSGRFAVIEDPAGAVCALFEAPDSQSADSPNTQATNA